jgi:radical SAM superfamily enzyme YgiQ (UPF0313 family)
MILLIYPPFPDHLSEYPPIGLAQLAAVLEKNNYPVKILDLGLYPPDQWPSRLLPAIQNTKPEWIGISSPTSLFNKALDISRYIKDNFPSTKIVLGGVHPTVCPEEALQHQFVDYVIRGEGEFALLELLQGKEISKINGLSYKKEEKIIHNPKRELIANLDELPFPARHLFDLKRYSWYPEISLISSRGCPFTCYYCFNGVFGRKFRARSAENIVKEMEQINKQDNIKDFYFYDDTFTLDKKRVLEFCELLVSKNNNFSWRCCSRIDTLDLERIQAMKKAGCTQIHFGIETGNPILIKKIKNINLEQAKSIIKMVQENGLKTRCYFMIGHPWDTEDTIKQTIKFAKELDADSTQFSITTPFPQTELWNIAKEMNIVDEKNIDWSTYFLNGDIITKPIMRTYTLSSEQLLKFYKKAYRELYLYKMYTSFKNPLKTIRLIRRRGFTPLAKNVYHKIISK